MSAKTNPILRLWNETYIRHAGPVAGIERVDCSREILPGEVLHVDGGIVGSLRAVVVVLVKVGLCDENWKSDVIEADVAPGHILHQTLQIRVSQERENKGIRKPRGSHLATHPRLEARGVDGADNSDVVEPDIGYVDKRRLVLAKGPDAHAVALVADGATLE